MTKQTPHVLIVEDNPADALLTTEALERATPGVTVIVADTGQKALDLLAEGELPDLVLLDLNLPGIPGQQVLETIRGDDRMRSVPVVVLSSSRADSDVARAYAAPANSYVQKPLAADAFDRVVEELSRYWFELVELP